MQAQVMSAGGKGLSPLARGNPPVPVANGGTGGPIPARAGEPASAHWGSPPEGAYPRSRGGTRHGVGRNWRQRGLSPLARGNLPNAARRTGRSGPIPARAGEPDDQLQCLPADGAYPRSRGGTCRMQRAAQVDQGLSPLARGNPTTNSNAFLLTGPIPARAGEPRLDCAPGCWKRAYPRSRGGTAVPGCHW